MVWDWDVVVWDGWAVMWDGILWCWMVGLWCGMGGCGVGWWGCGVGWRCCALRLWRGEFYMPICMPESWGNDGEAIYEVMGLRFTAWLISLNSCF